MATELWNIKRKYNTSAASLVAALLPKQMGFAEDYRALALMEDDGVTPRYWYDSTRFSAQDGVYGAAMVGVDGITGVTPDGGSSGGSGTVRTMLRGLAGMVAGTTNQIPMFTAAKVLGDSILSQSATTGILISASDNAIGFLQILNTNTGTDALAGLILTSSVGSPALYAASSGYTVNAVAASCLNMDVPSALDAFNIFMRGTSDVMRVYFGSPAAGTLFHTFSNKGIKLENLSLTTDADGTVAGVNHALSITKNDSNTRQFYGHKLLATLNTGGSNASTTINLLVIDTTNTAVTGLTTYLANIRFGGSNRFRLAADGAILLANSDIIDTSGSGFYLSAAGSRKIVLNSVRTLLAGWLQAVEHVVSVTNTETINPGTCLVGVSSLTGTPIMVLGNTNIENCDVVMVKNRLATSFSVQYYGGATVALAQGDGAIFTYDSTLGGWIKFK